MKTPLLKKRYEEAKKLFFETPPDAYHYEERKNIFNRLHLWVQDFSGEEGEGEGSVCNRLGCKGILGSEEPEGCCTCFRNPPCGFCTAGRLYCDECGWQEENH